MKNIFLLALLLFSYLGVGAQLYIAPGDSISVLPGTLFTLQEHLINNGKIYNNGILTLNGTTVQNISGTGNTNNLFVDNNIVMLSDCSVNNILELNNSHIFSLGNFQLSSGSINGTGLLSGSSNATLILNTTASSLNFDQTTDTATNALKNLTINNSSTSIQNKLYLYDALLPNAGTITLNDELILRSNISKTARVAPATSSFTYGTNGRFVIERYIPGRRAWRLLTAPVTTASNVKISDAWQDGKPRVSNINIISNPEPGYGTHVTFGLPATNGYDQGINSNPSIRYLTGIGWNGVPSATNDGSIANSGYITDQPGYMLFVRGDRGTLLSQATSALTSPTVLRPKGKINTGVIDMPLSVAFNNAGSSFRVVGNPYPSAVNFHEIITNSINKDAGFADAFYLWDPTITGNNGVGGFVGMAYNATASIAAGKPVYDRSVPSSIDNSGDIQSGSAFVIDYNVPATSLQMEENDKSIGSNNSFFKPARQLQTNLLAVNNDGSVSLNDGVLISMKERNNNKVDKNDLKKLGNFAEQIAVVKNGQPLCIEKRPLLGNGDTIFYQISRMRQKNYLLQLIVDAATTQPGNALFLEDVFRQQQTAVSFIDTLHYSFSITADTASFSSKRFRLVTKAVNHFVKLNTKLQHDDVQLQWSIADMSGIVSFYIERSQDSLSFETIGSTQAFTALDVQPLPGTYFYRIKCVNNKGAVSYSMVSSLMIPEINIGMSVYPNPVTNNTIMLRMKLAQPGIYQAKLMDNKGQLILRKSFNHFGRLLQQAITIDQPISTGIYQLEIITPSNEKKLVKVLVQR